MFGSKKLDFFNSGNSDSKIGKELMELLESLNEEG